MTDRKRNQRASHAHRFRLVERVGGGDLADVWHAIDGRTGDEVALKMGRGTASGSVLALEGIHASLALSPRLPELVDLGWVRRTSREALVVPPDQLGRRTDAERPAGGGPLPFVAVRWIRGVTLDAAPALDPLSVDAALRVARDAAEALADLHGVGLAHGDVKPGNLVRTEEGRVALIDLGLTASAYQTSPRGGTPRYLASGDTDLGDGRARDLLALGVLLAELVSTPVRAAQRAVPAARSAALPAPLSTLCRPLLAPAPGARPSARWVRETAAALLGESADADADRSVRRVRATYLRVRRDELRAATEVDGEVASWLSEALQVVARARAMDAPGGARRRRLHREAPPPVRVGPLDAAARTRWLAALVGSPAAAWPSRLLAAAPEPTLAEALTELASRHRPERWTLSEVEQILASRLEATATATSAPSASPPAQPATEQLALVPPDASAAPMEAAVAAELSLRIARAPFDALAVEAVERHASRAPTALVLAAADALRLAGQLGRARGLVWGLRQGDAVVADVLRRAGDLDEAVATARRAIAADQDPEDRARACLARILLDTGALDDAAALVASPTSAPAAEVAALLAVQRGEVVEAIQHAERGSALAISAEQRARLAATAAYARFSTDPATARSEFRTAVAHAVQAGAVLEEASYRTGEAAACVDLGELEAGITTARRASVLWEDVLSRPPMAARALVAIAAAFGCVDARHEAARAARQAAERAREGGDGRGEAYALWGWLDAQELDVPDAAETAERAARLAGLDLDAATEQASRPLPPCNEEQLHAAARLWRFGPDRLVHHRAAIDEAAERLATDGAQGCLAWWHARAERLLTAGEPTPGEEEEDARRVLQQLVRLASVPAAAGTRGRAMHAGCRLARALDDVAALRTLDAARRAAADLVRAGCPSFLAEAARACPWIGPARSPRMEPQQALDLQRLVRALGDRGSLRGLLDRVLDLLLMWTGAERGLLLLQDAEGTLTPRSARNLSRRDISDEQLTVSRSLARQALQSGEPVVAVDAMQELSQSHQSVHALKLRSVLTVPLISRGDVLGVVYLDDRVRRGAFGEREVLWAQTVAPVAALAIADAAQQAELRRAVRSAERRSRRLARSLAHKETALDLAERELAKTLGARDTRFRYDEIVGQSPSMQRMLRMLDRICVADVPVLLRGESGSGKELVARAIHRHSPRSGAPFVGENCGALPEPLLESALFGHARGAFTGALRNRVGLFEAADGGSLFLDEIGEMSLAMQAKLLRVLEDGEVRPLGSERLRRVDVRIVAATHRDLEQMVEQGQFREDLYYRLNVITVTIPPLRERSTDIPLLVRHLLAKHAAGARTEITVQAMRALQHHPWPGNVRQLENEVRRALLLTDGIIDVDHLTVALQDETPPPPEGLDIRSHVDRLERELVKAALAQTGGNQTRAAELLGISRYGLHKMMKRLRIPKPGSTS